MRNVSPAKTRLGSLLASVTLVAAVVGGLAPSASASPAATVALSQTLVVNSAQTASATVASGTQVTLSIGYSCANAPCTGSAITVPFPAGLSIGTPQLTAAVASTSVSGNNLDITMIDPLAAGSAGQILVPLTIPANTTPDGTNYSWRSSMSATDATTVTTDPVSLTATASNNPTVTTALQSGGALDQPSTYTVQVCSGSPNEGDGPLEILPDSTLVTTLPGGAAFQTADTSGSWSAGGAAGTITWNLGAVAGCQTVSFTVEYQSSDDSNTVGASKIVSSSWTGQSPGSGDPAALGQDSTTTTLVAATVTGQFSDWSFTSSQPVGEGMTYFITANNTGNTTWTNLSMTDQIDPKMQVTTIVPDNVTSSPAQLWVSSRLGGGSLILAATVPADSTLSFNPYTTWPSGGTALAGDDVVQSFEVIETGVAPNASFTIAGVDATPMAADLDGNATNIGDTIDNTATFSYSAGSTTPPSVNEQCTFTIAAQIPTDVDRNSGPGTLAQNVRTGSFQVTEASQNFPTPNPVLAHLLAPNLSMTSWSMQSSGVMPTPALTEIDNFAGTGWTLYRWTFPNGTDLATNASVSITINVTLGAHAWGTLVDKGYVSSTSITPYCDSNWFGSTADVNNILGDGDATKVPCEWDASISPAPSAEASVTTSAEGHFSTSMVAGPGTAYTTPGNADTYAVVFNNNGTLPLNQVQVIDVLPRPGDTDILSGSQRNGTTTTFPVELAGTPVVPALSPAPVVSYSTVTDPCQPDLSYSPGGCNAPAWTTSAPSDLGTVTAVKVDFGSNSIDPFSSWEVDLPVTSPTSGSTATDHATFNPDPRSPQNDQIAYDTAAFIATNISSSATLLPAESNPVALRVPSELGPETPAPSPSPLTSDGVGTAAQTAGATVPTQGSVSLLDGSVPVSTLTVPDVGTYSIDSGTGVISFTPVYGYAGTPSPVDYQVTDAFGQTGQASYTPTVAAPSLPAPPALTSTGTGADPQTATLTIPVQGSVTLTDGSDPVSSVTEPHVGTYSLNTVTGVVTFVPDVGYIGTPAPVTYRITDAYGTTRTSTYTPTVTAPVGPPAPTEHSTPSGGHPQSVTPPVPPRGSITLVKPGGGTADSVTIPSQGTYTLNPATGTITFAALASFFGAPTPVAYRVTDAYGQSATGEYVPGAATAVPVLTGGAVAATPSGAGYWSVSTAGTLSFHGNAANLGSENGKRIPARVVGVISTRNGNGYWLVGASGIVYHFGDAGSFGDLARKHPTAPIVEMARTPDDGGYWLVSSSGIVYPFGDAHNYGSVARVHLNQPVVAITATPDGKGYWLAGADGGVFTFGDARFYGSMDPTDLYRDVNGIVPTLDGRGYWLLAYDGGVFAFGDARFYGSLGPSSHAVHGVRTTGQIPINGIIVGISGRGYRLVTPSGISHAFGTEP